MNKLLSLVLVLALTALLIGCAKTDGDEADKSIQDNPVTGPSTSDSAVNTETTLDADVNDLDQLSSELDDKDLQNLDQDLDLTGI